MFSTRKVSRNGLIFQIPTSVFSTRRYTVHPDGTGTSWDEAAPDVDQPHGLDYRSLQDLRKGIRKRLEHEHSDLADATVGGIHTPGGCAVLGIEDGTATILADGTLKGHGLVWDNTARIWCSTATAGASTTGDFTLVLIHPDKQWGGGDITWTGGHQFDASVSFDSTEVECGGSAGIGLFYDPTSYAGNQSITFPNGLIMKQGSIASIAGNTSETVTFAAAFPNAITNAWATWKQDIANDYDSPGVHTLATGSMKVKNPNSGAAGPVAWLAIGY